MEESGYRRPFGAGNVLGKSVGIWFANVVPFTLLAGVVYSPLIAYTYLVSTRPLTSQAVEGWAAFANLGSVLFGIIVTGALIYGVLQQIRGESASLGKSLAVGLRRLFPCLGVAIVIGIVVGAFTFVGTAVTVLVAGAVGPAGALVALLAAVPVIWIVCVWFVAVPVAVIEKPGVGASLTRSAELTRGSRLQVFAIVLVVYGASTLATAVVERQMNQLSTPYLWTIVGLSILFGTFQAVNSAVVYHDLRVSKEGVGIDELVSVFA